MREISQLPFELEINNKLWVWIDYMLIELSLLLQHSVELSKLPIELEFIMNCQFKLIVQIYWSHSHFYLNEESLNEENKFLKGTKWASLRIGINNELSFKLIYFIAGKISLTSLLLKKKNKHFWIFYIKVSRLFLSMENNSHEAT